MDGASLSLLIMLIIVAIAPFLIAYQITSIFHSSYRHQLWVLRDRITDDLRTGRVARSLPAIAIHSLIERQITVAGRHTLADSLLAIIVMNVDGETSVFEEILDHDLPEQDKYVLIDYLRDYKMATHRHLKYGSVFGWVLTALLLPLVSLAETLVHRADKTNRVAEHAPEARDVSPKSRQRRRRSSESSDRKNSATGTKQTVAQEIGRKIERAEVEIMPEATPSRSADRAMDEALVNGRA